MTQMAPDPARHYDTLTRVTGSLFLGWARLEGSLAALLRQHLAQALDMPQIIDGLNFAAAIFGSARFKALRDTLKRIATVTGSSQDTLAFMDEFFAHLGHIESLRDKLAHQQIMPRNDTIDGVWMVADYVTTRDFRNVKKYEFTADTVLDASRDVLDAAWKTTGLLVPHVIDENFPGEFNLEQPAWRYKPSSLVLLPRNTKPSPLGLAPRQRSSLR